MLSNSQKSLIKRAQRQTGLDDADYRDALEVAAGVRSATDPGFTDRGVDLVMAYLEAIYWRQVDAGVLPGPGGDAAVFRQRGYWASQNPSSQTSRDRWASQNADQRTQQLEAELRDLGFGDAYLASIRQKVVRSRSDPSALFMYRAALARTLRAKRVQRMH